jgi:hypothetical protein
MAVSDIELSTRFAHGYVREYPLSQTYLLDDEGQLVTASSSPNFQSARLLLMETLLQGDPSREQMAQSLIAEQIVKLSLRHLLQNTGFCANLAPQTLECGTQNQKGVDVIVVDTNNLAYLGIDVKCRVGKSPWNRDGYGWNQGLLAPFIYLSLGNWKIDTYDRQQVPIKEWLSGYAIPKIAQSGKIPHFFDFERYIAGRIERSLNGFTERIKEDPANIPPFLLPKNYEAVLLLEEKLAIMQSLFIDLQQWGNNT